MKIIPLKRGEELNEEFKLISNLINKSKKIVTLTGAGISCNAGIPDFRSSTGLYKHRTSSTQIKGKDLFDISLFRNDETIEIFCKFMESLYDQTLSCKPTKTHKFINFLKTNKKLIKCYTQNIDGLERQCGLTTGIENEKWKDLDVIQLHGDLNKLSCTLCYQKFEWNNENKDLLRNGFLPDCPNCLKKFRERESEGKRIGGAIIGNLRPNIVLYGENHPFAESLAKGLISDLNKNPNILLIFGTSLKVHGVKKLVKDLSKKIHEKSGGKVIFINKLEIGSSNWKGIIDYQILCDCDQFCDFLQNEIPELFLYNEIERKMVDNSIINADTSAYFTPPSTPDNKLKIQPLNILDDLKTNLNDRMISIKELASPEFSPVKKTKKIIIGENKEKLNKSKMHGKKSIIGNEITKKQVKVTKKTIQGNNDINKKIIKSLELKEEVKVKEVKRAPLGCLSVSKISIKDNSFAINNTNITRQQVQKTDITHIKSISKTKTKTKTSVTSRNTKCIVVPIRRSKRHIEVINYDDTKRNKTKVVA